VRFDSDISFRTATAMKSNPTQIGMVDAGAGGAPFPRSLHPFIRNKHGLLCPTLFAKRKGGAIQPFPSSLLLIPPHGLSSIHQLDLLIHPIA
jgi:hypothetical protein